MGLYPRGLKTGGGGLKVGFYGISFSWLVISLLKYFHLSVRYKLVILKILFKTLSHLYTSQPSASNIVCDLKAK